MLLLSMGFIVYMFVIPLTEALRLIRSVDSEEDVSHRQLRDLSGRNALINQVLELIERMNRQKEQEYSLEILKKQAELNALQSQINPHFLYNTLDSIRGQLLMEGIDDAADTLEALSNMFRYSINPKSIYNTLEQELENVNNYMSIITYRFGNRVQFRKVIDTSCSDIYNCEMPKMTLQPIIENAIQHGLEHKLKDGLITLRAFISEEKLYISVADNGVGISSDMLDELNRKFREGSPVERAQGSGIALVNVNERIRLLYGKAYGIYVNSDVGIGTEVHISLPVQLVPTNNPVEN